MCKRRLIDIARMFVTVEPEYRETQTSKPETPTGVVFALSTGKYFDGHSILAVAQRNGVGHATERSPVQVSVKLLVGDNIRHVIHTLVQVMLL